MSRPSTSERATLLAGILSGFPQLGQIAPGDLLSLLDAELGSPAALEQFVPYTRGISKRARPPQSILHICSGNLANPGILSLTFGLLLGSQNLVKLPRNTSANDFLQVQAIPAKSELERFIAALPENLSADVTVVRELSDAQIAQSEVVIVYGSDETCGKLRRKVGWNQKFITYGHRLSFGIVLQEGITPETAKRIAWDTAIYDQQGCLSPHDIYVQEGGPVSPTGFAAQIAQELELFKIQASAPKFISEDSADSDVNPDLCRHYGVSFERSLEEQSELMHLRSSYTFRSANDPRVKIWQSEGDDFWTVIYEDEKQFATSCLNRVLFIKPFRKLSEVVEATALYRPYLSTIGVAPLAGLPEQFALTLGALRYCELGTMQSPPLFWLHDGRPNLADLVTWVEREESTEGTDIHR